MSIQSQSINDSLFIEQLNAIRGICKEINSTNKTLKELIESSHPDTIKIRNLIDQSNAIENLNENQNRITGELINRINTSVKGNSFFRDAGVEAIGALLGILGTLLFFIWGLNSEKRKKSNEEKRFKKELVTFGGNLIEGILDLGNKQYNELGNYVTNSKQNPFFINPLPFYVSDDIKRIGKLLENQDFFHSFLNEIGKDTGSQKKYKNIVNALDFLSSQYKQLFEAHEKAMQFDLNRKTKYKEIVELVLNKTAEFCLLKSSSHQKLVNTFDSILKGYANQIQIDNSIATAENYVIFPLKQVMLNHGTHIADIREIIPSLTIATQLLSECKQQNNSHYDEIEVIRNTIKGEFDKLEENSKEIINYKKKDAYITNVNN